LQAARAGVVAGIVEHSAIAVVWTEEKSVG
jgi:hypothetical protein